MVTLETFYQTKMWKDFREYVVSERTDNETGLVYCEYCGKPIANKVVCHHIKELTEDNVNDFDISLNPENISLLHIACHNKIHDRFNHNKEVILVWGSPLSYMKYLDEEVNADDFIISMDYIYKSLNVQSFTYSHSRAITNIAFKIKNQLMELARYRSGNWSRCFVVGTYPNKMERERVKADLGITKEVFIDIPKEECLKIAEEYKVPHFYYKYIDDWYKDVVRD